MPSPSTSFTCNIVIRTILNIFFKRMTQVSKKARAIVMLVCEKVRRMILLVIYSTTNRRRSSCPPKFKRHK